MNNWSQQVNATIALLCERFPSAFVMFERRRRPLKLGIIDDIVAALGAEVDPIQISRALRYYTNNTHYRAAQCRAGAARIGLDGAPCGEVSPEHAEQARKDIEARRSKPKPKPEMKARFTQVSKPTLNKEPIIETQSEAAPEPENTEVHVAENGSMIPVEEPTKQALAQHPPEQVVSTPKRLGLADLKRAARQRVGSSA